jgi:Zn-dependent protease
MKISIAPSFYLMALLIGFLSSGWNPVAIAAWVFIILVSVLVHEMGHGLTALAFGHKAEIRLVIFGGVTTYQEGPKLPFWKQFVIVFNGPLFGFGLAFFAYLLKGASWPEFIEQLLEVFFLANLFWSGVNLLPILPLDGGQLLRIGMEALFGLKGFKASLLIGMGFGVALAIFAFVMGWFLAGALLFLFGFQSFEMYRKSKRATDSDREEAYRSQLMVAEEAFQAGRDDEARRHFQAILKQAKEGLIAAAAGQYIALIDVKEGKREEAYQLLLRFEEDLADETLPVLHELADEFGNREKVAELSADVFRFSATQAVALRNARAFAAIGQARAAGGWLKTARELGELDLPLFLSEEAFRKVKEDPEFQSFLQEI